MVIVAPGLWFHDSNHTALSLDPESSEPYKYLGIVYLDAFYQYESAIKEMQTYVQLAPHDVFGRNYLGYLYYRVKNYQSAVDELKKAIELRPDNCYAFAKLARIYTDRYLDTSKIDPRRPYYHRQALAMFDMASAVPNPSHRRIKWLQRYLLKKGILD